MKDREAEIDVNLLNSEWRLHYLPVEFIEYGKLSPLRDKVVKEGNCEKGDR
jgi:hypothetical protein